jgi:hypothetical protein
VVEAIGNDDSVGGAGERTSQKTPPQTTTTATADVISRTTPNHSIHARARSPGVLGPTGLDKGSTSTSSTGHARACHHQEGVGGVTLAAPEAAQRGGPDEAARQNAR